MNFAVNRFVAVAFIITSWWLNIYGMGSIQESKFEANCQVLFHGVTKINNDLYVGKVADEFYVAMERVKSEEDVLGWIAYASEQMFYGRRLESSEYLKSGLGVSAFRDVLSWYSFKKISPENELWIAYASSKRVDGKANLKNTINIEMFFTVVTSEKALITSHMGISRSVEAAIDLEKKPPVRKKHFDQSIHLHSFAAKVMKLKNRARKYMLTTPLEKMRSILLEKMPKGSIFVGDNLYREKLAQAEKNPKMLLGEVDLKVCDGESQEQREIRLDKIASQKYESCKGKIAMLKNNPTAIIRSSDTITIKSYDSKTLISCERPRSIYSFVLSCPFIRSKELISSYQWLFTDLYQSGFPDLPYVLIDLDALAEVKALESQVE